MIEPFRGSAVTDSMGIAAPRGMRARGLASTHVTRGPCEGQRTSAKCCRRRASFANGPLESMDFGGLPEGFGLEEIFPHALSVAHDGFGNYWVADGRQSRRLSRFRTGYASSIARVLRPR
jgi:hypothetical protein